MTMTRAQGRAIVTLLAVIVVVLAGATLRATYLVSMPFAFAFFVAVLVWPLHEAVADRVPEKVGWLATVVAMLAVLGALGGFLGAIFLVVYGLTNERGGELTASLRERWEAIVGGLEARGIPVPDDGGAEQIVDQVAGWAGTAALSVTGMITVLVLVVFFTLLMLVEARHWKEKGRTALPQAQLADITAAISRQVRAFILVQAFVASVTALVTAVWLWAMGMPLVLLWTLLTFVADFVPNAGPTAAAIFISAFALLALGWQRAFVTIGGIVAIQQFFGNYIDPLLKGRRMSISPLVVLLSVVFWAWVWGPVGALLAVPMTATIIIACGHVPRLRPIALLMHHTADVEELDEKVGTDREELDGKVGAGRESLDEKADADPVKPDERVRAD